MSKSYKYLFSENFFLDSNGESIAKELIHGRFEARIKEIQGLLEKYKLTDCCEINQGLLKRATLDYFADIARLKEFHGEGYMNIQPVKIYAYETFWYLRRRPIQIVDGTKKYEEHVYYVNEFLFNKWLIYMMAQELEQRFAPDIQVDDLGGLIENSEFVVDFGKNLYYTFRYRHYTAQSLLLMIESFMAAAQSTLQIT